MQHFVTVLQGYMAHQVLHVTWEEFQRALQTNVRRAGGGGMGRMHTLWIPTLPRCTPWTTCATVTLSTSTKRSSGGLDVRPTVHIPSHLSLFLPCTSASPSC